MRGQVAANLEKFKGWVEQYGDDAVVQALLGRSVRNKNSKGQAGTYRITCHMNRKDRMEMIRVLGLKVDKTVDTNEE